MLYLLSVRDSGCHLSFFLTLLKTKRHRPRVEIVVGIGGTKKHFPFLSSGTKQILKECHLPWEFPGRSLHQVSCHGGVLLHLVSR